MLILGVIIAFEFVYVVLAVVSFVRQCRRAR